MANMSTLLGSILALPLLIRRAMLVVTSIFSLLEIEPQLRKEGKPAVTA
jgi:hypothetical protein